MTKKDKVLGNWMKEFFPYSEFLKAGIFTKEMKGDYQAQSQRICFILSLDSIYEYGKEEIRCHISFIDPECEGGITSQRPLSIDPTGQMKEEPFISITPSVWV